MEQLVTRRCEPVARVILGTMPGLLLEGGRQVGKSTLARQLAGDDAVAVSLDDELTLAAATNDPAGFVAQAPDRTLVIDEIQWLPSLMQAILDSIDEDPRPGRFIITASSSIERAGITGLSGRVGRLNLYGLSRGEMGGGRDDFAAGLVASERPTSYSSTLSRGAYARIIEAGAFPEATDLLDHRRQRWLDDYAHGIVTKDMPRLRRIFKQDRAISLLHLMAAAQAGELIKSHLAEDADIPATTIDGYIDLLADTWLFATLPTWAPNFSDRELVRPKGLIIDSGLATRLWRFTAKQLSSIVFAEAFESLLEGLVISELLRQRTWTALPFDLYHYRDRMGAQVDLIMQLAGGRIIALEVRATSSFQESQFKHLKALRDKMGSKFIAGVVLNTGQLGYPYDDRLYGLPTSAVWQL